MTCRTSRGFFCLPVKVKILFEIIYGQGLICKSLKEIFRVSCFMWIFSGSRVVVVMTPHFVEPMRKSCRLHANFARFSVTRERYSKNWRRQLHENVQFFPQPMSWKRNEWMKKSRKSILFGLNNFCFTVSMSWGPK